MEQHPVPQNVTTFQFRLIGDMTIKQFGYLCIGAILAYISYKLPLPFFFTWPLTVFFGLLGIGFAFVPIEERPMDVWVMSFFKSIYSPTQYIWSRGSASKPAQQKQASPATVPTPPPALKPAPTVSTLAESAPEKPITPKADFFSGLRILTLTVNDPLAWIKKFFKVQPKSPSGVPGVVSFNASMPQLSLGPIPSVVGKREKPAPTLEKQKSPLPLPELAQSTEKGKALEQKVQLLEHELSSKAISDGRVLDLQKQLTQLLGEKRALEEQLVALKRKTIAPQVLQTTRPAGVVSDQTSQPTIKIIDPSAATKAGLPRLTTYPNIVTGIIKDTAGNLLPGVLVTVRDKEGIPLRALKTNKLGQFAASTQLPPATYLVEVEDPRGQYVFDRAQIVVNNTVLPAIEIIAKSQKELERAKLAQQIFGNQG